MGQGELEVETATKSGPNTGGMMCGTNQIWNEGRNLGASEHGLQPKKNKMKPTNPNAHTYVNGTDVKTHGYAVTHNTFLQ